MQSGFVSDCSGEKIFDSALWKSAGVREPVWKFKKWMITGAFTTDEHRLRRIKTDKIGEHQISSVLICGKNDFYLLIINFQTGSEKIAELKL